MSLQFATGVIVSNTVTVELQKSRFLLVSLTYNVIILSPKSAHVNVSLDNESVTPLHPS